MPELAKVKRNIKKMLEAKLSEADIDEYLGSEGVTFEQLQVSSENASQPTVGMSEAGLSSIPGVGQGGTQPPEGLTPTGEPDDKTTWMNAFTEGFSNIPSSAKKLVKDMIAPLLHPMETAKQIGETLAGGVAKLIPGEQMAEDKFDAVVDFMKERYGSSEKLKETISKDPVGVASDVSTVLMAGGGLIKTAGTLTKASKVSQVGKVVSKAGAVTEPVGAAIRTVAAPLKKLIPKEFASKLYQSGAKFSTTLTVKERSALTNTALENAITPTIKGVDKAREMINVLNNEITELIDFSAKSGAKIKISDFFKDFKELEKAAMLTSKPKQNVKLIQKIRKDFIEANMAIKKGFFTPQEAQKLKQNIYKSLDSYYSSVKDSPIAAKAQKLIAKNAKEALEVIVPEIKQLNATEGELLALRKAIERSSARIQNRDLLGIGVPIKGGLGAMVGDTTGAVASLALGVLDTPAVKSRIAIAINKLKKQGIVIRETPAAIRLGLFQEGRAYEEGL